MPIDNAIAKVVCVVAPESAICYPMFGNVQIVKLRKAAVLRKGSLLFSKRDNPGPVLPSSPLENHGPTECLDTYSELFIGSALLHDRKVPHLNPQADAPGDLSYRLSGVLAVTTTELHR